MMQYIGKRILTGILSLFVLVTIAFFLTRQIPGSPFQSGNVSDNVLEAMEEEYGLNQPVLKQYGTYMENLLRGDLGISYKKTGVTVREIIGRALPATFTIGVLAALAALTGGVLIGIVSACSRRKAVHGGVMAGVILGTGLPNFVIALLLALVICVKWKLLPVSGLYGWKSYILPVVSLALYPMAVTVRMTENAFREEMGRDYVQMARLKGLKKGKIIRTHILRNALIPVLNYIGPQTAFLLTGSFAVESIFSIPGLGREFVNSIVNRDYTLILGLTVFMGAVVIGINLLTDILCACLTPQIRRNLTNEK